MEKAYERHQQVFDATRGQKEVGAKTSYKGAQRLKTQLFEVYSNQPGTTNPMSELRRRLSK